MGDKRPLAENNYFTDLRQKDVPNALNKNKIYLLELDEIVKKVGFQLFSLFLAITKFGVPILCTGFRGLDCKG